MGTLVDSGRDVAPSSKNSPRDDADLEVLAEYVVNVTSKQGALRYDALWVAAVAVAGVAVAAGFVPVAALAAAIIVRVAFKIRQSSTRWYNVARINLMKAAHTPGWQDSYGGSAPNVAAKAFHVLCATQLAWGLGVLLVALRFPVVFAALAVPAAVVKVIHLVTATSRVAKAQDLIDTCVASNEWAAQWQRDRKAREAAVAEHLATLG